MNILPVIKCSSENSKRFWRHVFNHFIILEHFDAIREVQKAHEGASIWPSDQEVL